MNPCSVRVGHGGIGDGAQDAFLAAQLNSPAAPGIAEGSRTLRPELPELPRCVADGIGTRAKARQFLRLEKRHIDEIQRAWRTRMCRCLRPQGGGRSALAKGARQFQGL